MYNLHLIKLFANSKDNLIKCRICIFCIHDKSFSISNLSYFGVKVEGGPSSLFLSLRKQTPLNGPIIEHPELGVNTEQRTK